MTPMQDLPVISPPAGVLEVVRILENAGHEAWCVGGSVRDALLNRPSSDWDLTTDATPDRVQELFPRTVPVGIDFGTVGVLDSGGLMHEITTFRADKDHDGRHATVEFGTRIEDDLARRDFTINAIAWSPTTGEFRDPFHGRIDLGRAFVRAVGDAGRRMVEDRLRALRAIRIAAKLGFQIHPGTWAAVCDSAPHLGRLSMERVRMELEKTLDTVREPGWAINRWDSSGAFRTLAPELHGIDPRLAVALNATGFGGPYGYERRLVRFGVLFSDLDSERVANLTTRLRFSRQEIQFLSNLAARWRHVRNVAHDLRLDMGPQSDIEPARSRRHIIQKVGRQYLVPAFRVAAARGFRVRRMYRRILRTSENEPIEVKDLAVNGSHLLAIGLEGREIGRMLHRLLDVVIEDPDLNTETHLLALAKQ